MKPLLHILFLLLAFTAGARPHTYDVVIVGGTPAGITAAVAAAREGKNSVILERSDHVGGLPVNGLGATDIATRGATAGLFARFVALNKAHYTEKYGADSQQARDCSDGPDGPPVRRRSALRREARRPDHFDPHPRPHDGPRGTIPRRRIHRRDLRRRPGRSRRGSVPDRTRRSRRIRRTVRRKDLPLVEARPRNYDREEYVSLVGDVLDGRNTDARYRTADSAAIARNRRRIEAGERTSAPGDVWGMAKVTSMTRLPNAKTDANNQHLALISTDLPEENWPWPTAGWAWRDRFAELPAHFREACLRWGLAADEYRDNDGFPRQVYVREGRRLEGCHFFTAKDALPEAEGKRPPLHRSSVTASHYALDSHAVRKREPGRIHLDGFFSHPTAVYTVPYGVMVPRRVENLLFPTAVSGSHVGFSTLRMEPCWMALGEAAGTAAALAADRRACSATERCWSTCGTCAPAIPTTPPCSGWRCGASSPNGRRGSTVRSTPPRRACGARSQGAE